MISSRVSLWCASNMHAAGDTWTASKFSLAGSVESAGDRFEEEGFTPKPIDGGTTGTPGAHLTLASRAQGRAALRQTPPRKTSPNSQGRLARSRQPRPMNLVGISPPSGSSTRPTTVECGLMGASMTVCPSPTPSASPWRSDDPQEDPNHHLPRPLLSGRVPDLRGGQRWGRRGGRLRRPERLAEPEDDGATLRRRHPDHQP